MGSSATSSWIRLACWVFCAADGRAGASFWPGYAELITATTDIKIAVRACKTKKRAGLFSTLPWLPAALLTWILWLPRPAGELEEVFVYLSATEYAEAANRLKESNSAFEKWCDDRVMGLIKEQKSNPFTIGPLLAYIIARQNEINMVRIILSGKLNELPDSVVRERLRELYV